MKIEWKLLGQENKGDIIHKTEAQQSWSDNRTCKMYLISNITNKYEQKFCINLSENYLNENALKGHTKILRLAYRDAFSFCKK